MTTDELKDAHLKYVWHRNNSKRRNIPFNITFDEWLNIWLASGHWYERGVKSANNYVMSRKGDTGPYSPDNVVIKSNRDNVLEGNVGIAKPKTLFTCVHCRYIYPINDRERHWAGQRCRQKKAPRRMLSKLTINY